MADDFPEVHVGDLGTKYRVRIMDEDGDFDPSDADEALIRFRLPTGSIEKTAVIETEGSPAMRWYLTYTVEENAGPGSPGAEFHAQPGKVAMQGYLHYADGNQFSTQIITKDEDGHGLRIYKNIDV